MTTESESRTCSNCKFFVTQRKDDAAGWCQRYPPVPAQQTTFCHGSERRGSFFASVMHDEWCGEFKAVATPSPQQEAAK